MKSQPQSKNESQKSQKQKDMREEPPWTQKQWEKKQKQITQHVVLLAIHMMIITDDHQKRNFCKYLFHLLHQEPFPSEVLALLRGKVYCYTNNKYHDDAHHHQHDSVLDNSGKNKYAWSA